MKEYTLRGLPLIWPLESAMVSLRLVDWIFNASRMTTLDLQEGHHKVSRGQALANCLTIAGQLIQDHCHLKREDGK